MYNQTVVSVRGWAGADPRTFDNGKGGRTVVFPIGVTPRVYNRTAGKYENGRTIWYDVRCYGRLAENVALSVRSGAPVIVRGALVLREWADREGVAHRSFTIVSDAVGIDLNTVKAEYTKSLGPGDAVDGEPQSAASNTAGAPAGRVPAGGGADDEFASAAAVVPDVVYEGDGEGTFVAHAEDEAFESSEESWQFSERTSPREEGELAGASL